MDKQYSKGTMVTRDEGRSIGNEKSDDEWSITVPQDSNSNSHEKSDDECSITVPQDSNSNSHKISGNERQWLYSLKKSREYIVSSRKPKMQMVPNLHRKIQSNISCYEPLVVSIGPFHHGKSELQPMEKYKEVFAVEFADQDSNKPTPKGVSSWRATNSASIDELYGRVKNIMPNVRECYAEDSIKKYSYEKFTQMMFLDGCFILQYLHCIVTGNYKELKMKSHDIAFIRGDLFLLENQLPFEVLQVLMSCKFKNNEGMGMINDFISSAHNKPDQGHGFIQCIKDFFRNFLGKNCQGEGPSLTKQESEKTPLHLLELLKTHLIDPKALSEECDQPGESSCDQPGESWSYRSAKELRKAGIHLRPGKSPGLLDVKFDSFLFSSLLTLPPMTVDDSTKSEFLNLVAYEACPDTPDEFGVTSYLCFIDSLIDHAEDVEKLRSKGILLNCLGSDQEVADLFNEITRDLVPNPRVLVDVKKQIENHYKSRTKIWIAEWNNTHFTNPWTVLAFIAAIFVICLQVSDTSLASIQAYYAVHPKQS
ncbi:UPF0481 protein At3g47200-like [Lycium ferocissimum]|uniref:UPF0481 protein At3g47200-like n=1 Tax=Lycium ferocissimum TaxID=112874 RepID=UPI0028158BA7|nr:UPF0481 protein At3g47200-like [Lycium ferocissimum]